MLVIKLAPVFCMSVSDLNHFNIFSFSFTFGALSSIPFIFVVKVIHQQLKGEMKTCHLCHHYW